MFEQIFNIFVDILTPVFLAILLGYIAGPRWNLDPKTLSNTAYFIFLPAFIFHMISTSDFQLLSLARIGIFAVIMQALLAFLGFTVAKILGRSKEMIAAYVMIAVFANTGNFGLSIVLFSLGEQALLSATVYMVSFLVVSFAICIGIAEWTKGSKGFGAIFAILKSPGVLAFIPAVFFMSAEIEVPLFMNRLTDLLGRAMIPTMLFTLGVQLRIKNKFQFSVDMVLSNSIRLIGGPLIALFMMIPFGVSGTERDTGILIASMPLAVLASIIAIEYEVVPEFVVTSVLFSTLLSLFTLTLVIYLL